MIDMFEGFGFNEPATSDINEINGIKLPEEYLAFMQEHDGGEGTVGEAYVVLYSLDELAELNKEYDIAATYKNCFIFGSDGGDMLFAFNASLGKYYQIDACNCDDDDSNRFGLANTLNEFFEGLQEAGIDND